ncbi:MAG: sugar-binding protein [Limnochordia bacterium]|jgi:hypothetical protein
MSRKSVYLVPILCLLFASVAWGASEPVNIPKMATAPAIDGDLADWAGMPGVYVSSGLLSTGSALDGDDDLSFWFMSGYDDDTLYVAYRVIDDVIVMEKSGSSIWQNDCAELWLNGQQLGVTLANGQNSFMYSFMGGDATGTKIAVKKAAGGYNVEIAVPKAVVERFIGKKMASGTSFQFSFGVDDADTRGGDRDSQIYYPRGWEWNVVSTYATATFE